MRLNIELTSKNNIDIVKEFITTWLIPALKNSLRYKVFRKLQPRISNFNNLVDLRDMYAAIDTIDLFHYADDRLLITIDSNKFNHDNSAKLYDLCALVNFGSLECSACPIFTETFDFFAENFWAFYKDYQLRILPKCQ